jgi:DNA-binding LytR/AlgR family response regulator
MRIAICDDEQNCREDIHKILLSHERLSRDLAVALFASGKDLLDCYSQRQRFDLIFLDVEMPELDGLQTGAQIRALDAEVIIVFLTSHKQYVFESLRIEIFDYLMKPAASDIVHNLLERAYRKYKEQRHIVQLQWQGRSCALEVGSIVYVEGYHRHTVFFTAQEKYECVGKLDEYDAKLTPYGFLRCHQGFLINMKYIQSIEKDRFKTTTGHFVEMSVRRKPECLRSFNNYLTRYRI